MTDSSQYLLVVYQLAVTDGEPVESGQVAGEIGRSPSATTEMLQRLAERGLVDHEPYAGVRLTDQGRETAADLHESYQVLRQFFDEVLGLDAPDAEARAVAGSVSPLVADRLASTVLTGDRSEARRSRSRQSDG